MREPDAAKPKQRATSETSPSPQRSCIACRRRNDQASFLRLAFPKDGSLGLFQGSGRSAYVCPDRSCLDEAFSKGKLDRALRRAVPAPDKEACKQVLICKLR